MLHIAKIDDYLKILTQSLFIFLTTPDEVEKYVESNYSDNCVHHYNVEILNLFDPELRLINTKRMIKNKSKEYLSEFKKFNVDVVVDIESMTTSLTVIVELNIMILLFLV